MGETSRQPQRRHRGGAPSVQDDVRTSALSGRMDSSDRQETRLEYRKKSLNFSRTRSNPTVSYVDESDVAFVMAGLVPAIHAAPLRKYFR
jgi:hypothetical protein